MPWANGRGATEEIATDTQNDEWSWRVSLAEVVEDGPFSLLPDIDRSLLVCSGAGMDLSIDGKTQRVALYETVEFDGASETICALIDGPVRDLNLMVRREAEIGRPRWQIVRIGRGDTVVVDDALAVVVLDGVVGLTTAGTAFPFTPRIDRAARFDALIFQTATDDSPVQSLAVLRDCVIAYANLELVG